MSACGDDDDAAADAGASDAAMAIENAADNPFPCLNAVPADSPGAYLCDNGLYIRARPVECTASASPNLDECTRDADCEAGTACVCATPNVQANNQCFLRDAADCRSDLDCADGFHCANVIIGFSDWAIHHMRCQHPSDQCATADDCLEGLDAGSVPMSYLACQANQALRFCHLTGW